MAMIPWSTMDLDYWHRHSVSVLLWFPNVKEESQAYGSLKTEGKHVPKDMLAEGNQNTFITATPLTTPVV